MPLGRILVWWGLLGTLGAAVLAAQSAVPSGLPGTVEGRVSNAVTGEPVAGASVHLFPFGRRGATGSQAQTAATQRDGIFHFDSVPRGTYFLIAGADGYVTTRGRLRGERLVVDSGQQITDVSVQLTPQGSISGKVLDENGQAVPGARVEAYTTYVMRGKLQLRRGNSATANEAGEYTLKKLNPGKYYLSAESALSKESSKQSQEPALEETGKKKPTTANDVGYVRTFYPSGLDVQSATPFELTSGQQGAGADIRLKRAMTYRVQGKVAADGGMRVATVLLSPRGTLDANVLGASTHVAKDGTFELKDVLPGSYTLWLIGTYSPEQVSPRHYAGFRLLARQDVDVTASNINGIVLSLTPPLNLTGHISAEGIDKQRLAQVRVNLVPSGDVMMGSFQSAAVDQDGNFAVQNLSPGTYSVRVSNSPAGTYVKEVDYNRQDITVDGLDASLGGGGEVDIVIRSGAGEVNGTVQSDSSETANPATIVVLVPDNVAADGYGTLTGPVSGNAFTIRNVPPGHYYAYAIGQWESAWQSVDFLREIQRAGTSIDVRENARVQVELPVLAPDDLEGARARLGFSAP